MDPKNYQNYTWINLCSLLPIKKVLKSNPNLIISLTPNLTKSFSTLWFFFWDTSFCKHHTWHIVRNLLNFFHNLHIWYHEILTNLMMFRLCLLFYNLKAKRPHIHGHVSWTRCVKFLFISRVRPHTRLSNMNIIFQLIYSIIWILVVQIWQKNSMKSNKLIKYSKRI